MTSVLNIPCKTNTLSKPLGTTLSLATTNVESPNPSSEGWSRRCSSNPTACTQSQTQEDGPCYDHGPQRVLVKRRIFEGNAMCSLGQFVRNGSTTYLPNLKQQRVSHHRSMTLHERFAILTQGYKSPTARPKYSLCHQYHKSERNNDPLNRRPRRQLLARRPRLRKQRFHHSALQRQCLDFRSDRDTRASRHPVPCYGRHCVVECDHDG
jgi:hypothetical protein